MTMEREDYEAKGKTPRALPKPRKQRFAEARITAITGSGKRGAVIPDGVVIEIEVTGLPVPCGISCDKDEVDKLIVNLIGLRNMIWPTP